jgi:hypothetical protein
MGAFWALKKDILTDLAFKLFACTSLQDHRQPTAHLRNTQRRVSHDDTRIDLDHLDHSAAVRVGTENLLSSLGYIVRYGCPDAGHERCRTAGPLARAGAHHVPFIFRQRHPRALVDPATHAANFDTGSWGPSAGFARCGAASTTEPFLSRSDQVARQLPPPNDARIPGANLGDGEFFDAWGRV